MKKLICLLLILCLSPAIALAAPPDLSVYSYDQLVALQHYITMEIMKRPEWKEVTVPGGTWYVGVDIPAGEYSISPAADGRGAFLEIYNTKGKEIVYQGVRNESNSVGKVQVEEGYTIVIDGGSLLFAPAVILGF